MELPKRGLHALRGDPDGVVSSVLVLSIFSCSSLKAHMASVANILESPHASP